MNPKSKRVLRIGLTIFVALLLVFWLFGAWYKSTYSMKAATSREMNDPGLELKVLIATQGSEFKDNVVSGVISKLESRPIYIKVIDVSGLSDVKVSEWTAIVIIHTWEMGEPPKPVADFIKANNARDLIVLATSGDGNYHIDGVDGITSASKLDDTDRCVHEILNRIEFKIAPEEISNFN